VAEKDGERGTKPKTLSSWPSLTANFLGSGFLNPDNDLNSGGYGGLGEEVEARWGSRIGARCSAVGGAAGGAMDCIGGAVRRGRGRDGCELFVNTHEAS
jgi:hypothetical protein